MGQAGMIGAMHSLEMECRELEKAGVVAGPAAAQAAALERGAIFSVFEELRFALYAAVAAITAGIGLLVKDNLDRIGPITLIAVLALASAGCYATALRTQWQGKERSIGGDYLLLLGALIVSADLGYAESQFHWLGTDWQWYLVILSVFHGVTAYGLRSRLVLCTSIAALAAWFGIEGRAATLFNVGGSAPTLGTHAIACAGTLRSVHTVRVEGDACMMRSARLGRVGYPSLRGFVIRPNGQRSPSFTVRLPRSSGAHMNCRWIT